MAGRPFGADDSSPVREPGDTSLLSTMLKPGLSGMPMRPPGPTATSSGGTMTDQQRNLLQQLLSAHGSGTSMLQALMQMMSPSKQVFGAIDNQSDPESVATRPPPGLDWAKRRRDMANMQVYHDPEPQQGQDMMLRLLQQIQALQGAGSPF
jgi:hypothetical protein